MRARDQISDFSRSRSIISNRGVRQREIIQSTTPGEPRHREGERERVCAPVITTAAAMSKSPNRHHACTDNDDNDMATTAQASSSISSTPSSSTSAPE